MKAHDLREMSLVELRKRLSDEEENLANLRFQLATSQLDSPIKVRLARRDVARIRTVLRQKEAAGASESATTQNTEVKQP